MWGPLLLTVAAVLTAGVSAATGMAGGVLLLAALTLALPAIAVVPIHGAVQLVAGGSRAVVFRQHVDRTFVWRFALGLVPGSILGAAAVFGLAALDPMWLRLVLGGGILASLWPTRSTPEIPVDAPWPARDRSFAMTTGLGALCGVVGMLVGSTGPLVSRGLLAHGLVKERHVGTKAWAQAFSQVIKLPLFGLALAFDYAEYAGLIVVLAVAVVVGTLVGGRLLTRLSADSFVGIARALLLLLALHIVGSAAWSLSGGLG